MKVQKGADGFGGAWEVLHTITASSENEFDWQSSPYMQKYYHLFQTKSFLNAHIRKKNKHYFAKTTAKCWTVLTFGPFYHEFTDLIYPIFFFQRLLCKK